MTDSHSGVSLFDWTKAKDLDRTPQRSSALPRMVCRERSRQPTRVESRQP